MRLVVLLLTIFGFASVSTAQQSRIKSNLVTNEISGDVQLLSHYVDRGLSMSDTNPAMNASFLYNVGEQVRMGFWGSNISNLSAIDDNFWFKFLAEFNADFGNNWLAEFYISDSHFYKSNQRNGFQIGVHVSYYSYYYGFEWMNNLEGTKSNAEYLYFRKMYYYNNKLHYGGHIGLTYSHQGGFSNYFDLKALIQYNWNADTVAEVAFTYNTNASYFGKRGDPAIYAGIKLSY